MVPKTKCKEQDYLDALVHAKAAREIIMCVFDRPCVMCSRIRGFGAVDAHTHNSQTSFAASNTHLTWSHMMKSRYGSLCYYTNIARYNSHPNFGFLKPGYGTFNNHATVRAVHGYGSWETPPRI